MFLSNRECVKYLIAWVEEHQAEIGCSQLAQSYKDKMNWQTYSIKQNRGSSDRVFQCEGYLFYITEVDGDIISTSYGAMV